MAVAKCPVCDWEITDKGRTVRVEGKTVTVCSDECARALEARKERVG